MGIVTHKKYMEYTSFVLFCEAVAQSEYWLIEAHLVQ